MMTCSFAKYSGVQCGKNPGIKGEDSVVSLISCQKDIGAHVRYNKFQGVESEVELILARTETFAEPDNLSRLTICPQHRYVLGTGWKRSTRQCTIPNSIAAHKEQGKFDRSIGKELSKWIFETTGCFLPVGSGKYHQLETFKFNLQIMTIT